MIPLLGSQLQFYQKKSYKLQMEVITLQEQLLSLKTNKGDQYKIKYEMLLDRVAEQNQLKESKMNQSLLHQERTINEVNQKWQGILSQKIKDFKVQVEALTLQKNSLKNKTIELELRCIKLQKEIDDGDSQVLKIKLDSIRKDNDRLRKDSDDLYRNRQETVEKMERDCEMKVEAIKQRQKSFYRDQIQALEKKVEQTEKVLESQRQKISPERQNMITSLKEEIGSLKRSHDEQIQRLTALIEKRTKEMKIIQEEAQTRQKSNYQVIDDQTNQLKALQEKLFRFKQEKDIEIKAIQIEMSKVRQKEADGLKKELQKMRNDFDIERQQWRRIIQKSRNKDDSHKKEHEQQKKRFLQQKNRLKTKITELKIRLKDRQEENGKGQTQILIKSLRQMNNNQAHFNNYEDAITFMDRQVRKASLKIEEKNRQIANLLQQLKMIQKETESEISQMKQKSKSDQKKLYDKIFAYEQEVDNLNQKLKEKQKFIKKKEADLSEEKEGHKQQVQNLKKIIDEMERDYKRLTGNKKNIEESYRQERQNVISGKLDVNQERKKKWTELIRQRNELQIVYRERERQIRGEHQIQIDKLKREKQKLIQEREEYKAETEILREKLKESSQYSQDDKIVEYQKQLATMDLEIALTQNLFSTLSNVTALKEDVSQKKNSKVVSSHSFQLKGSGVMSPLYFNNQAQREDIFKAAMHSFTPYENN